jgi:peroxiredoxin
MLGKPVADFSLPSTGGSTFSLSGTRGKKLVLYLYPKDKTPARLPRGGHRDLQRKVRGIERSTFVVDEKGVLAREWRGVKSAGPRPGGIELC